MTLLFADGIDLIKTFKSQWFVFLKFAISKIKTNGKKKPKYNKKNLPFMAEGLCSQRH